MVAETQVTANNFIVPLFVVEGMGVKEEIVSMSGYYRLSLDNLEKEITELWNLGLKSGGRTESILMSLPMNVRFLYDYHPEAGSEEDKMQQVLMKPIDWI